jgi:DNA-binding CsgD family transcriptional regulator
LLTRRQIVTAAEYPGLVLGALADGQLEWTGEIWELARDRASSCTPRLTELIGTRLAAVSPAGKAVLELLALCEPVPLADAEAVAGDPHATVSLEEAGLVRVTTERRRTSVTLAHPLYGEILRAQLPVLRGQRLLMAHTGRTRAYGARRRDDTLHVAAWQLAATGTADPALLIQGAKLARYAHDYPQALALLQALPEAEHNVGTRLLQGEVLFQLGQSDEAERIFAGASAWAVREPDIIALTTARTLNLYMSVGIQQALAVNQDTRTRVTTHTSQRVLDHNEASLRVWLGQPRQALALLRDLGDIDQAPDLTVWLTAATFKSFALEMTGRSDEAVAFAEQAYQAHLSVDDRSLYVHPAIQLAGLAWALAGTGRIDQARTVGERGFAELTAARLAVPRIWMALILGRIEWMAGHPASARNWFAEAMARADAGHNTTPLGIALTGVAACAALLGDAPAARQALARAPSSGHFDQHELHLLASAWLAANEGDLEQARAVLTQAARAARLEGLLTSEARLLTEAARLGGAAEVAGRLAELAAACNGPLAAARAHLAAALATRDPEQLIASATELERMGADSLAATAAAAAAAEYRRGGQARKATAAGQQAQALTIRCDGARTSSNTAEEPAQALTDRERDIALLAARGASSNDIAQMLHLSVRTVEKHLQNTYTKLGVTNRRDLAQRLAPSGG